MHPLLKKIVSFLLHNPDLESPKESKPAIKEESPLDISIGIFESLVKNRFNIKVFSSDNSDIQITVPIPSIEKYIKEFGNLNLQLKNRSDVSTNSLVFGTSSPLKLKAFFQSSDGYYHAPSNEGVIYSFLNLSILLEYKKILEKENRTFTDERNLRIIRPVVSCIMKQAKELNRWISVKQNEDTMKTSKVEHLTVF